MLADVPTFFHQLWNKGIDIWAAIIASTISAGIVAGIATAAWRWNKRRDLRHEEQKQHQQNRIAAEFAEQRRVLDEQARQRRLAEELSIFITQGKEIPSKHAGMQGLICLADLWDTYLAWLKENKLEHLPSNLAILNEYREWSRGLRGGSVPTLPGLTQRSGDVVSVLRRTQLS